MIRLPDASGYRLADTGVFPSAGFLDMNRKGWAITETSIVDLNNNRVMQLEAPSHPGRIEPQFINDEGDVVGFYRPVGPDSYGFWVGSAPGAWENGAAFERLPGLPRAWMYPGHTEDGGQEMPSVSEFYAVANGRRAIAKAIFLHYDVGGVTKISYPGPTLLPQVSFELSVQMSNRDQMIAGNAIYEASQIVRQGVNGNAINDKDQVAGSGEFQASLFEKFVLPNGQKHWDELNLNELIMEGTHWVIDYASDINNYGVILAEGKRYANPADPAAVTDEGSLLLLPFELNGDLNDNGKAGEGADSSLKIAGVKDDASDQAKENGTEYLIANNKLSNGLPDDEDPKAPSDKKEDDDLQELKTICAATWGAIWFEYDGGDIANLAFYPTRECKQTPRSPANPDGKMTFPFALSTEAAGKLPEKLYVRAEPESAWKAQVEGKLVMKFGKADKSETWAEDKLRFTVVKGLGDTKYLHAARDYIMENNTLFFTDEKDYGGELMRVTVMRQEAATMQTYETFHRIPKHYGITQVVAANAGQTLIVNGNFVYDIQPPPLNLIAGAQRMTRRCNGILIQNTVRNNNVSTDSTQAPPSGSAKFNGPSPELCGPKAKYVAQKPNGTYTFAAGEVPVNAGYNEAIGGLSTNFGLRESEASNMVGEATIKHVSEKKLVFSAQTDPRKSPGGNGGGTVGFATDVGKTAATLKQVLILDGGSSVAMAFADPNANPADKLTEQYGGVKGNTIIGYYVNTYLMFKCQKPR